MKFQCGIYPNATNLCLAGNASCEFDEFSNEICTNCPSGYTHDDSQGHFPNCALPVLFFPILLGLLSPFYLLAWIKFVKLFQRVRDDVRRICSSVIFLISFFWGWLLALVLEKGNFQGNINELTAWFLISISQTSILTEPMISRFQNKEILKILINFRERNGNSRNYLSRGILQVLRIKFQKFEKTFYSLNLKQLRTYSYGWRNKCATYLVREYTYKVITRWQNR